MRKPVVTQVREEWIAKFHRETAKFFVKQFGCRDCVIQATKQGEWGKVLVGTKILFELCPGNLSDMRLFDTAETQQGDRRRVLLLSKNTEYIWLSWSEEWLKIAPNQFELIGFSMCFFAGAYNQKKTQLLRAEWDNPAQRGPCSAQPHWHIDPNVLDIPYWNVDAERLTGLPTLEELPVAVSTDASSTGDRPPFWSMKRMHLGMAGWYHNHDSPACWQHRLDLSTNSEIRGWMSRTLAYAISEFDRVAPVNGL